MVIPKPLLPAYLNTTCETQSTTAKIEKPHGHLEASSPSYYYRQRKEDSGARDHLALLSPLKPNKDETHPRWLRSVSHKTQSRRPPLDTTVMAVRKLQEHRVLLHCFSPMVPKNVETHLRCL